MTFEGPEGSGKTTQIKLLTAALEQQGRHVVATREPGGTRIGNAIRSVLLEPTHTEMSPRTEALLFNAARAQLVDSVILPALARGEIVLCDRYADSTLAYQGYGHRQPLAPLEAVITFATQGLTPQLTIYLDLPVRIGLARKRAGDATEWNRIEEQALQYHEQVRQGYLQLAKSNARWLVLDATEAVEQIHHNIMARVARVLA